MSTNMTIRELTFVQLEQENPKAAAALRRWIEDWIEDALPELDEIPTWDKWRFQDRGTEGGLSAPDPDGEPYEFIYFPDRDEWDCENR